jgi:hypothetical protein
MNKLLKEFADKVASIMPAGVYNVKYDSGKSGVEFTEDALEKFAELIVRECAGVIADAVEGREPASTYVEKIREHFGVDA